jgi:hypothetical protein
MTKLRELHSSRTINLDKTQILALSALSEYEFKSDPASLLFDNHCKIIELLIILLVVKPVSTDALIG